MLQIDHDVNHIWYW